MQSSDRPIERNIKESVKNRELSMPIWPLRERYGEIARWFCVQAKWDVGVDGAE
jgi:hypothetical protein